MYSRHVTLDHIFFSTNPLLHFVNELYEIHGIRNFFFDEVHKYPGWNQELKNIYDSYPDVKIVFSGSSSLDLVKGTYDLSRRAVIYKLKGLSFREYLSFKGIAHFEPLSLAELLEKKDSYAIKTGQIEKIRGHFKDYLRYGYYPFFLEDKDSYNHKLFRVIQKTVFEDIANFYKLKTDNLCYFQKILAYIATIPPGDLSRNSIARQIGLDNKTIQTYLNILTETGLTRLLCSNKTGSHILKRAKKIYLDNPNLYQSIVEESGYLAKIGSVREIFFISMLENSGNHVYYSHKGDFMVNDKVFEVGGRSKKFKQIKNLDNAYLAKDDILYGGRHEIPLYLFGFLY